MVFTPEKDFTLNIKASPRCTFYCHFSYEWNANVQISRCNA